MVSVLSGHYIARLKRFAETRPPCARLELICRTKKRFARDNININTIFFVVPVLIVERQLGSVLLRNLVL